MTASQQSAVVRFAATLSKKKLAKQPMAEERKKKKRVKRHSTKSSEAQPMKKVQKISDQGVGAGANARKPAPRLAAKVPTPSTPARQADFWREQGRLLREVENESTKPIRGPAGQKWAFNKWNHSGR